MPTTTTGIATSFIDFTRASNATVTDSDGLIKWAPHNLLTWSEQFDNAAWTQALVTPTSNTTTAPNGTLTADTAAFGASANARISQSITTVSVPYTFSVWLKADSAQSIRIGNVLGALSTVSVTTEWQQFSYTFTPSAGANGIGLQNASDALSRSVYVWGAALYRSDLGGMQPNTSAYPMYNPTTPKNLLGYTESLTTGWTGTNGVLQGNGAELVTNGDFSGGSTGWTLGTGWTISGGAASFSAGAGAELIQTGRNFAANTTYKITFDMTQVSGGGFRFVVDTTGSFVSSYFTTTASHTLVFSVGATSTRLRIAALGGASFSIDNISVQEVAAYEAPNGLQTARAVNATAANGTLLSSLSLLASPYAFSIWLKRKTGSGTVEITVDGTTYVAAAVTGTWTRFSTTLTPTAGTKTPGIRLVTSGDAVYAWGAQLSNSASLDSYVPVYGAAVTSAAYYGPRRDFDPVTLACKGLLVEELRTNLLLYSAQFDNGYWATFDVVVSGAAIASPAGSTTTNKIVPNSTSAIHAIRSSSIGSGGSRVISVYVYPDGFTKFAVQENYGQASFAAFDCTGAGSLLASAGDGSGATIVKLASGWYRVTMPATQTADYRAAFFVLPDSYTSGSITGSWSGDGVKGIYLWGAQTEAGSFATSYIPVGSTTAGATRNADVASVSTQAFPYLQGTGTIVANNQALSQMAGTFMSVASLASGLDESNLASVGYQTSGATTRMLVINTGSSQADLSPSGASASTPNKLGLAFATNDFSAVVNGGTAATDPTGSAPVATGLFMGASSAQGISRFNGHIRQITYLPRRISNAELQTRTA